MTREQWRQQALKRAGNRCELCGMDAGQHRERYGRALVVHHILARRKGGGETPGNAQVVCFKCHPDVGRPPKPPGEKWPGILVRMRESEFEAFRSAVPAGERAEFVRVALEARLTATREARPAPPARPGDNEP